jgi:microcystin-dependent protein
MKNIFTIKVLLIILIAFLIGVSTSYAVPKAISYQGRLLDAQDKPVANGSYNVILNFYKDINDVTPVSVHSFPATQVNDGIFSLIIEDANGLQDINSALWVGTQIDGQAEMLPRTRITSVPYSLSSDNASHAVVADTAKFAFGVSLPVGSIITWAGKKEAIPQGYLICDGSALNSKAYPELFNALGASWGDGTNSGLKEADFNLPDMRGMFLRGVDTDGINDPNSGSRGAIAPGANSGNLVGSIQNDQSAGSTVSEVSATVTNGFRSQTNFNIGSVATNKTLSGNRYVETRPKNVYVYYLIKVK